MNIFNLRWDIVILNTIKSLLIKAIRNGLGQLIIFIDFITRPQRMSRSEHLQSIVDGQLKELSLYQFNACPFCVKVRRSMTRLNLNIQLLDAKNDPQARQDLLQHGGRIKVPCLRIKEGDTVTWLYDSNEIIAYLDNRFGVETQIPTAVTD